MDQSVTQVTIERAVTTVVAELAVEPEAYVHLDHTLLGTFGFSALNRRGLAGRLQAELAARDLPIPGGVHPGETQAAERVRDLIGLLRGKFGV